MSSLFLPSWFFPRFQHGQSRRILAVFCHCILGIFPLRLYCTGMGLYNDTAIPVRKNPGGTPLYCVAGALSDIMSGLGSVLCIRGECNIQIDSEIYAGRSKKNLPEPRGLRKVSVSRMNRAYFPNSSSLILNAGFCFLTSSVTRTTWKASSGRIGYGLPSRMV